MITRYLYISGTRGILLPFFSFNINEFDVTYHFNTTILAFNNSQEYRIPVENSSSLEISITFILNKHYQYQVFRFKDYLHLATLIPFTPETFSLKTSCPTGASTLTVYEPLQYFFEIYRRKYIISFNLFTKEYLVLLKKDINKSTNQIILDQPLTQNLTITEWIFAPGIPFILQEFTIEELTLNDIKIRLRGSEYCISEHLYL